VSNDELLKKGVEIADLIRLSPGHVPPQRIVADAIVPLLARAKQEQAEDDRVALAAAEGRARAVQKEQDAVLAETCKSGKQAAKAIREQG
jgi:hypothetical protein